MSWIEWSLPLLHLISRNLPTLWPRPLRFGYIELLARGVWTYQSQPEDADPEVPPFPLTMVATLWVYWFYRERLHHWVLSLKRQLGSSMWSVMPYINAAIEILYLDLPIILTPCVRNTNGVSNLYSHHIFVVDYYLQRLFIKVLLILSLGKCKTFEYFNSLVLLESFGAFKSSKAQRDGIDSPKQLDLILSKDGHRWDSESVTLSKSCRSCVESTRLNFVCLIFRVTSLGHPGFGNGMFNCDTYSSSFVRL